MDFSFKCKVILRATWLVCLTKGGDHVEALPMRKSNEYEYEYGLFLYNATLILDIYRSCQKK